MTRSECFDPLEKMQKDSAAASLPDPWWKRTEKVGDIVVFNNGHGYQVGRVVELAEMDDEKGALICVCALDSVGDTKEESLPSEQQKQLERRAILLWLGPKGPFSLRDLLRSLWSNLVFGRVSRTVCRACDCNIWWNEPTGGRKFLGDNRDVLRGFSRQDVDLRVTIEYDYYYGFAGEMRRCDKEVHSVPILVKDRVHPVIVEQDVESLGVNGLIAAATQEDDPDDDRDAGDTCVHNAKANKPAERGEGRDYYESSFHFASGNFARPLLFEREINSGDPVADTADVIFETDTYSVIPPQIGQLLCGVPTKTGRGLTLAKWWTASESFFELWKMITSVREYAPDASHYDELRKLRWRQGEGEFSRFYQEVAQVVLFGKTLDKMEPQTRRLLDQLGRFCTLLQNVKAGGGAVGVEEGPSK